MVDGGIRTRSAEKANSLHVIIQLTAQANIPTLTPCCISYCLCTAFNHRDSNRATVHPQ